MFQFQGPFILDINLFGFTIFYVSLENEDLATHKMLIALSKLHWMKLKKKINKLFKSYPKIYIFIYFFNKIFFIWDPNYKAWHENKSSYFNHLNYGVEYM